MWQHYFVPRPAFAGNVYTWFRSFEGLLSTVFCFVRYCFGWVWPGRRMYDKVGLVAEIPECFCQKTEVAMPKEPVSADGEVGVEKNFQEIVILI